MDQNVILAPVIQYGFAGFSAVLLGILVWMIRILLSVVRESNKVISENTTAVYEVRRIVLKLLEKE